MTSNMMELDDISSTEKTPSLMQPRPSSPVAKTLDEQQQSDTEATMDSKISAENSKIPNLLPSSSSTGKSVDRLPSRSPPTIVSSPLMGSANLLASPLLPAAPPSTPYTPYNGAVNMATVSSDSAPALPSMLMPIGTASKNIALQPPLPSYRPSAMPPPPPVPEASSPGVPPPPLLSAGAADASHYNALLERELRKTAESEKSRIASLTQYEDQNYTTVDEYKHALSRERRHSASLAAELTQYKFSSRYASCNVHSAAEIDEEARVNALIKNIGMMKRDMNEDRCRVVMELEREEERIINGLMMRLEDVEREKMLLEQKIGSVRSGGRGSATGSGGTVQGMDGGGAMGMNSASDEQRLMHAQFEQMMANSSAAEVEAGLQRQQEVYLQEQQRRNMISSDISREEQAIQEGDATTSSSTRRLESAKRKADS